MAGMMSSTRTIVSGIANMRTQAIGIVSSHLLGEAYCDRFIPLHRVAKTCTETFTMPGIGTPGGNCT